MPNSTLAQMGFLNEQTQQETVYDMEDTQARSDISTINGKIPSGASSSNKMATASDITDINNKIPSAASSSNKLVDTTAMNDAIGQAVSAAYKPAGNKTVAELTSSLLVAANRGKVYNMTDAGTTTADFVEGAGQPIRIGDDVGICEPTTGTFKFNLLSGFIAVDTNPTQGSANPVSSGGVHTELDGKISKSTTAGYVKNDGTIDTDLATTVGNKVDKVAGKGLSTNDYDNTAKGIVDTAQDNINANTKLIKDTVGWSGKNLIPTKTSNTSGVVKFVVNSDGTITINGTAPSFVSFTLLTVSELQSLVNKYGALIFNGNNASGGSSSVRIFCRTSAGYIFNDDAGEATIPANATITENLQIQVVGGYTASDYLIKPMIRPADILDDTYEPYFGSTAFPRSEQAVLGAKNLLENVASSKTEGNVTYTVNDDGSVSVATSDTASSDVVLIINNGTTQLENGVRYILSGNEASHDGYIYIRYVKGGNVGYVQLDDYDEVSFINDNWTSFDVRIVVKSGKTVNKIFYPMIRLATDPDPTFAPFAMTNKELTDVVNMLDFYKKGETISGVTCFAQGYITSGGLDLFVLLQMPKCIDKNISNVSLTMASAHLRIPIGGYLVSDGEDIYSYLTQVRKFGTQIGLKFTKSGGWGVTNDIPVIGEIGISGTFS